ncbi:MAG: flavin reductase family protein [Alphaproteobacteria bacterium]
MTDSSDLDPLSLRKALGCFATGVTIVTTQTEDGTPIGVTMNSFSSVSLEPPLILFSLSKTSDQYEHFMAANNFAVNVLCQDQEEISNRQAMSDDKTLDSNGFRTWSTGAPILKDSIAAFDCTLEERLEGGDHIIFLCRVLRAERQNDAEPLIFHQSKYARLTQPAG